MEKENKPSFFGEFFKKCYFIPALFFLALYISILSLDYKYKIISSLKSYSLLLPMAIAFGYFGLFLVGNFIASIKKKQFLLSDAIALALLVGSVAYLFFITLYVKSFGLFRLLFFIAILFLLLVFIIFRIVFFSVESKKSVIYYTKNNINGYILTFTKKYSFLAVILASTVIYMLAFIMMDSTIRLFDQDDKTVLYAVLLGVFTLTFSIGSTFRRITLIDPALISSLISVPPMFLYASLLKDKELSVQYLIAVGFFTILVLFFCFIRYSSFNISVIDKSSSVKLSKCPVVNYFGAYIKKYSILLTVATASLLTLATLYIVKFIPIITNAFENSDSISYPFFSLAYVIISVFGTLFIGLILSLCNIKSSRITYGDFFTVLIMLFSLIATFTLNNVITEYDLIIDLSLLIISTTVLISRIKIKYQLNKN